MVFLVVSFLLAFPPIPYMDSFSPPFVLHALLMVGIYFDIYVGGAALE
jgi:hypothetical protein